MTSQLTPATVYLDAQLRSQIEMIALSTGEPKAAVMRTLIQKGLHIMKKEEPTSADALLSLAGIIPKGSGLPKDLSIKHDTYAWGE